MYPRALLISVWRIYLLYRIHHGECGLDLDTSQFPTLTRREMSLIAITGATGALGAQVAQLLARDGHELRLLVRDPARAPRIKGAQVARISDYADRPVAEKAMAGADIVFMVSAHEADDRLAQHKGFIDAAASAGVGHIVYTSLLAASPSATFTYGRTHFFTEQHIISTGLRHTFLRDNFYQDILPHFADEHGVISGPADTGRASFVARSDVAEAAASVLANPNDHVDAYYDLTGPAALSFDEIAHELSSAFGRPYSFEDQTVDEAYSTRKVYPAAQWEYDGWVSTYTAIRDGELDALSPVIRQLTGHEPIPFRQTMAQLAQS